MSAPVPSSSGIPFIDRTGAVIERAERGLVQVRMPFEPNINHVGIMYAGALFTLAEFPGGVLFGTSFDARNFYPIVKDVQIRFRRPATTDVTVEVTISEEEAARVQAEAEEHGKADFTLDAELIDTNGVVVAISKGEYQIRSVTAPIS